MVIMKNSKWARQLRTNLVRPKLSERERGMKVRKVLNITHKQQQTATIYYRGIHIS